MRKLLLTTVFSLLSVVAKADDIALQEPSYGGTGCPQGTVGVALSPDAKSLSVVFDQYLAEAGKSAGKTLDRKTCNLVVPIHIPQGMSVSVLKVDYRGYTYVPRSAQAKFDVEYFLKSFNSNNTGPKASRTFNGPVDKDYLISHNLGVTATVWSACGEDVNLRINSSITARTNSKRDDVLATVDSTDIAGGMIYHLQWKKCNKK